MVVTRPAILRATIDPACVALLRSINVGGKNRIQMVDLVACFESAGYEDVRTFIQSREVVFRADRGERAELTSAIEQLLADAFDTARPSRSGTTRRCARSSTRPRPGSAGNRTTTVMTCSCDDVFFLMPPLTPDDALGALTIKDGVDAAWAGPGVVYHSRLTARAAQSRLSRLISHPVYQRITIRNWNTTTRLLSMMSED